MDAKYGNSEYFWFGGGSYYVSFNIVNAVPNDPDGVVQADDNKGS